MNFKITLPLLALASTLSACASVGPFNGQSSDAMQMVVAWKNPDYGAMTDAEYAAVNRQATFCKEVADKQMSSAEESELALGLAYGVAGAVGVAGGAQAGGIGSISAMGPYGAIAGAANGVASGALVHSNAKAGVVGTCTAINMSDAKSRIPGVHATSSYVRTTNKSGKAPSWTVKATPGQSFDSSNLPIEEPETPAEQMLQQQPR